MLIYNETADELLTGMMKAGLATSKQEVLEILKEGDQVSFQWKNPDFLF